MNTSYQEQLTDKISITRNEFSALFAGDIDVYASPPSAYRMRAEFKAWQQGDRVDYAMYQPGQYKTPYIITQFEAGSDFMQQLMPQLLKTLNQSAILRHKLFQIEFLTSTTNETVVTLIYHKPLSDEWKTQATIASEQLSASIVGRSRKQKIVIGENSVIERFSVMGQTFSYQQVESSFTQPNASVCQDMLNWASKKAQGFGGDLLELYCGNGNFTLPLAQQFNKVLATEVSKASIQSAQYNCQLNNIDNINFVRMSSEELTQALNKERPFRRLQNIDLSTYRFTTIFVDPPRAGLDAKTNSLIQRFDNIIYISCNPETLKQNIEYVQESHYVKDMALFDQFPFTHHRECGAILKKKFT